MGRKSKTEKAKVKIKFIESQIKKITQLDKKGGKVADGKLEQEIEQEGKAQFGEFMSTGERVSPVLSSGQIRQARVEDIAGTAPPEAVNSGGQGRGFSLYEINKAVAEDGEKRGYKPTMAKPIVLGTIGERDISSGLMTRGMSVATANFLEKRNRAMGIGEEGSDKEYALGQENNDMKVKRREKWNM